MKILSEALTGRWLAMTGRKSPWGGENNNGEGPGDETPGAGDPPTPSGSDTPKGPRNPWLPPAGETPPRRSASMDDILRQRRGGGGGNGGGRPPFPRLPQRPDGKSWTGLIVGGVVLAWLAFSTTHMLGPKEQGIVTTFGKYSRTIGSGVSLTLPWPIENVKIEDVTSTKLESIPSGEAEKLMLTSDQNLVDISYIVRWNIKDLKLYTFQLDKPNETVIEVAEAAMRAAVAEVALKDVMGGAGRAQIEQSVRRKMQLILDAYRSGIAIQGVEIKKTDAPEKVKEAYQKVTAAQQDAQRAVANARAWAQQLLNQAQGNAAEFDKVYEQYKLAPEVTRRRLYYETMERVLSNNDKVIIEAPGVTPYLPLPELKRTTPATPEGGQ